MLIISIIKYKESCVSTITWDSCVARGVFIPTLCTPLEVELLDIKEALSWCNSSRFSVGEVFADSKTAVNLINTNLGYPGFAFFLMN